MATNAVCTRNLLRSLINAAEKASNVARLCRENPVLLGLLVQEKTGSDANARFDHDFKTLADVVIQEAIKRDISSEFPEMSKSIRGEECPTFMSKSGDTLAIVVGASVEESKECFSSVMKGFEESASVLAHEIHCDVVYNDQSLGDLPDLPSDLDYNNLGIWIDPIDATAEYITGDKPEDHPSLISASGLDCVTVLIGVYDRISGLPIIGVVSQPFHKADDSKKYVSRIYWGVAINDYRFHNCPVSEPKRNKCIAILSSSESENIQHVLSAMDYDIVFSAGAGHKALRVLTGEADLYLLSKSSTFKWDTCAPQAVLRAMEGNFYDYHDSVKHGRPIPLSYGENKANMGGLIAVRDTSLVQDLLMKLQ